MVITQDTKSRTRIPELGGGLESDDGRDYVIGIEELEENVSVKGGEHIAADRTKLEACERS